MTPRYAEKSCFCTFFHVQPKHQNGHIFVDIEGFRPYLSKPSCRAPKWPLMVRLMQKERLKSPQKSPIPENQAIGSFWPFWPKRPFWSFWPAISEPGLTRRKKVPLRVLLVSTRPSYVCFWSKLDPPEARQHFLLPGLSGCLLSHTPSNSTPRNEAPHQRGKESRSQLPHLRINLFCYKRTVASSLVKEDATGRRLAFLQRH